MTSFSLRNIIVTEIINSVLYFIDKHCYYVSLTTNKTQYTFYSQHAFSKNNI